MSTRSSFKLSRTNNYISIVSELKTKKSTSFYTIEDYRKPFYLNNKILKSLTLKPNEFVIVLLKYLRFFLKNTTSLLPGKKLNFQK